MTDDNTKQILTKATLDHLQTLAQLPLDQNELESNLIALEKILHMFDIMRDIDTSNVDHLSIQAKTHLDGLRNDVVNDSDHSNALSQICPNFNPETQRIVVPQVVDN